jgi:hypothetical protein
MQKLLWGIVGLALAGGGYLAYDWHQASKEQGQPPKISLYVWSDAQGVRHFTDTPPPPGARNVEKSQGYAPARRPLVMVIRDALKESYESLKNRLSSEPEKPKKFKKVL